MRKLLTLLFTLFFFTVSYAAVSPGPLNTVPPAHSPVYEDAGARFAKLKMKEVEKLLGRKLTWKEKIAVKIYQWKISKKSGKKFRKGDPDKGKTAMIFGILGLALLFLPIPYLNGLGAIVSIVLALVLGYQARKQNPNDKRAKTAIILGWIGVGVIIAAVVLLIAVISSWSGGWG